MLGLDKIGCLVAIVVKNISNEISLLQQEATPIVIKITELLSQYNRFSITI